MIHRRRIIGGLAVWVVLTQTCSAQSLLYEVALETRIDRSEVIVEGRVVGQESFLDRTQNLIRTANTLEVYRVFKGDAGNRVTEVVTPGGRLGDRMDVVHPSQSLQMGDVGVFFLAAAKSISERQSFRFFTGPQGYLRYDELFGGAYGPFDAYEEVERDVHERIAHRVGREPSVLVDYRLTHRTPDAVGKGDASVSDPVITSISPTRVSAGTWSELTISGSGFGDYVVGMSRLVFHGVDNGSSFPSNGTPASTLHVIAWSDDEIKVMVPSGAGTGTVGVQPADRGFAESEDVLAVTFNRWEMVSPRGCFYVDCHGSLLIPGEDTLVAPLLTDANGIGGYTLYMNTSTEDGGIDFSKSRAVAPLERAITSWRNGTGFNVTLGGPLTDEVLMAGGANPSVVGFDSDLNPLDRGTFAVVTTRLATCPPYLTWWQEAFDITFERNFGSPGSDYGAIQSLALHELGHAHLLGHVNDPFRLMYAIALDTWPRVLDEDSDIAGGNAVLTAGGDLASCGERLMVRAPKEEGETPQSAPGPRLSDLFPNPFADGSRVTLNLERDESVVAELFDELGRKVGVVFEGDVASSTRTDLAVDGRDLASGVYLLRVTGEGWSETRVVVKM